MNNEKIDLNTNEFKTSTTEIPNVEDKKVEENKYTARPTREFNRDGNNPKNRGPRRDFQSDGFEEKVIHIKRVIKVTKGGRKFKFSALVIVGDKKGKVGFATAKSIEVPEAIKKASRLARKNLYQVKIVGEQKTIPHEYIGHAGAARVMLKPASEGKGIVASDIVRSVVELAGIRNIYSKNLGTNNPKAVVLGTIDALQSMKTKEHFEKLRDKKL